jgi:hypothetical protein
MHGMGMLSSNAGECARMTVMLCDCKLHDQTVACSCWPKQSQVLTGSET